MDCCNLSSTGLQDIDANDIIADNITILSRLNVSGITNLHNSLNVDGTTNIYNSLNVQGVNILNSINNLNSIINKDVSTININGSDKINFIVNNTQLTQINVSGLSVFHNARETIFPFNYEGYYNVGDRFNKLFHVMEDNPECIINFDATHNTVIRVREQDTINQYYYPRQIQFQSFQGTTFSKFDIQGLQVLDKYNNWYYINKLFSITNNSTLLCSDKIMVDSAGDLKLYIPTTETWLNVADNLFSNNTQSITEQINTATNSIIGAAGALIALANYYQSLQLTIAVVAGVAVGSGLLLAFTLKEDKFDAKLPLKKRPPVITNQEYYPQLELKYNETLILNSSNELAVNTTGFLCPYFGDLSLASTPGNITSNSSHYVVVTQLTQPITCVSSLNVSGNSNFLNNVTCMSNLNINGSLRCNNQLFNGTTSLASALYVSGITILCNNSSLLSSFNVSGFTTLSNNTTIFGSLNVSGFSKLANDTTLNSSLNVSGFTTLYNNTTIFGILNVSGYSKLVNDTTLVSSLNVSGLTTLSNNTTIFGTLNISGYSKLVNNTTLISSLNVSGFTTLSNNTTLISSLNISGFTTLSNNTTIFSSLNVSGFTTLNNTTLASSLNVSGRTIIGADIYNYSDSSFEVNKNLMIRNNITTGSRIDIQVGLGYEKSSISLEQGYDINISTPNNATSQSVISLTSNKAVNLTAPKTYISNDCVVYGSMSCLNVGKKSPIYFTTNRNININGTTFSCYDINLNKYVKFMLLDGYNTRNFRLRTWLADGDVQNVNMRIIKADIFMTDRGGLNIWALCSPVPNDNLNSTDIYLDQFLYRDTFNNIIYCSRFGSKKVYCIFEDLL